MPRVQITYLSVDGRYRRRNGVITGDLPRHLTNGVDKQAHSLSESPVYIRSEDPMHLKGTAQRMTWDHLAGNEDKGIAPVPLPPPPPRGEGLAMLCEDGFSFPISCIPYTDPLARQQEEVDTHAEAKNLARARQARANASNTLQQWGFTALLVGCLILFLVIAIVALQARFGGEPQEEGAAAQAQPWGDSRSWLSGEEAVRPRLSARTAGTI